MKRRHRWLIAWVSLAADIIELLCLGCIVLNWKFRAAKYFAGFRRVT